MIEFHIDGQAVEISPESSVTVSASIDELTDPESVIEKKYPIVVPMTPNNRAVMGFVEQTLANVMFNQTTHKGEIGIKGTTLLQGDVELVRCENDPDGSGRYVLSLNVKQPEWIRNATKKKIKEILLPYDETYGQELIRKSWTSDSPVKFLPVKRDGFPAYGQEQTTISILSHDNYHPFVQVAALMNAIAEQSGYRIVSEFLGEPFFQSLYMSGNYPEGTVNDAATLPDFLARRAVANKTATANPSGIVLATAQQAAYSVGNPVDTSVAYSGSANAPQARYYGKSFQMVNNRPAFIPDRDVIVGFEFQLQFSCAQSILSAEKLALPATVKWDGDTLFEADDDNPLTNLRGKTSAKGTYMFMFFHFPSGTKRLYLKTTSGGSTSYTVSSQQQLITLSYDIADLSYQYQSGSTWITSDEWAMYNQTEFNALPTQQDYNLTLRTQPLFRKKNEPVYFDTLTFEGGKSGSSFTFYQGATIKPVFYGTPETGSKIAFSSLFHHDDTQIKIVQAVGHLFGLHFYTDELTKTIYVEPRFTFLKQNGEIDWSQKMDTQKPMLLEEWGNEWYEQENFGYKSGDAAIDRLNEESGMKYGEWSAKVYSRAAKKGEKKRVNPLFTATKEEKKSFANASEASMIVVGNRNQDDAIKSFPAKIVRYLGMKGLPAGQRWGWPSYAQEYPLVVFHSEGEDWYTLCFDNQNGQLGLKNYIQPLYDKINQGKKLTLFLRLTPSDMEAILHPNSAGHNFRGNFKFNIRGEIIRARLRQVSEYNPAKGGSTRCVFSVEP